MELIFVYNAQSALSDRLLDYAHKIIKPSTYACNLCQLTHHNLGERRLWKQFKQDIQIPLNFYHKDEFKTLFKTVHKYPVILVKDKDDATVLLSAKEINLHKTLPDLIEAIRSGLTMI